MAAMSGLNTFESDAVLPIHRQGAFRTAGAGRALRNGCRRARRLRGRRGDRLRRRRRLARSRRELGLERGQPRSVRVANRLELLPQAIHLLPELLRVG